MKLALGCDHGGYLLKEEVKKHLDEKGIEYVDFGCHSTESCDYPDMADAPCKAVTSGECTFALLFCQIKKIIAGIFPGFPFSKRISQIRRQIFIISFFHSQMRIPGRRFSIVLRFCQKGSERTISSHSSAGNHAVFSLLRYRQQLFKNLNKENAHREFHASKTYSMHRISVRILKK